MSRVLDMVGQLDEADGADYGDNEELDAGVEGSDDDAGEGSSEAGPDNADNTGDAGNGGANQDPNQAPVNQQQQQKPQLTPLRGGLFSDQNGNIVDPNNGQILARAGSERRMYERGMRMQGEVGRLTQELQNTQSNLQRVQYLNNLPQKYQLGTDEVEAGLGIVAEFKKNPVEAARKVVELAVSMGHNVSDILGKNAGDAIEVKAIQRMLDEKLQPVLAPVQQQRQQAEAQQRAQQQLNSFIDQHEYADMHLPVLDKLIGQNPELTPQKAYYELRGFAQKYGLDFSKPLQPQIAAVQAQQARQQRSSNGQPQRQAARPMPNGTSANAVRSTSEADFEPASSSWESIIRNSMPRG